jgi:hypothetical protein
MLSACLHQTKERVFYISQVSCEQIPSVVGKCHESIWDGTACGVVVWEYATWLSTGDHRAHALVREQLHQNGVAAAAVNDVGGVHALADAAHAALDLRKTT